MHQITGIGSRLQEERIKTSLNQAEFAEQFGVSKRTQAAYESGTSSPDAEYLVKALDNGVDIFYILTGKKTAPGIDDISKRSVALLNQFEALNEEYKHAVELLVSAAVKGK